MHGGVGPGHADGIAPLADALVMLNTDIPLQDLEDCNLVSFTPAASANALSRPLPTDIGGIIRRPLLIRVTMPDNDNVCSSLAPFVDIPFNRSLVLNLGYLQSDVQQFGISEADLVMLYFNSSNGWQVLGNNQLDQSVELNWIAEEVYNDGIYAIGWKTTP